MLPKNNCKIKELKWHPKFYLRHGRKIALTDRLADFTKKCVSVPQ